MSVDGRTALRWPRRRWGFLGRPELTTAVVFGLFFVVFGMVENAYLERRSREEIQLGLRAMADEMAAFIKVDPSWDLDALRHYPFQAQSFAVCTNSGLILEIAGDGAVLIPTVSIPPQAFAELPVTIRSEIGEEWRILLRKVKRGYVLVGTRLPSELSEPDALLARQLLKLGDNLETSNAKGRRETETYVDFAVVAEGGQLLGAEGGLPLRTDPRVLESLDNPDVVHRFEKRRLIVESRRIADTGGRVRAFVLLPGDVSATERMLRDQKTFVFWSLFALWAASEIFFVIRFRARYRWPSIEEALRQGEGERIEFKGGFKFDEGKTQRDYLKSVAGFLNASGGTLFVGVDDSGRVCGIEKDLDRFEGSRDRLEQALLSSLSSALGRDAVSLVELKFEESGGSLVCRFNVRRAKELVFVQDREGQRTPLWVRIGNMTHPLSVEEAVRYSRRDRT
jgi:hypothetical protein